MKKILLTALSLLCTVRITCRAAEASLAVNAANTTPGRMYLDLDSDWRFSLSASPMAMQPRFDDSTWRQVNVPHDWSIEGPFSPDYGSGNGYAPGGIGWYRKHFRMPAADQGKMVSLELDGVYDNSEVWLNGFRVGGRPNGFLGYTCDLTNLLEFGADENVLAVRVDHSRSADSRWYTGSGIYRNVRLCVTDSLHLAHWGTYVTNPKADADAAIVHVESTVENSSSRNQAYALQCDVIGPDGHVAASAISPGTLEDGDSQTRIQELTISHPQFWSPDSPALYILRSRLSVGAAVIDETITPFGVRTLAFDPNHGFFLNGVSTKFKGVCIHQDGGSLGVAITAQTSERLLRALKGLGVNAIRTSHNPPSPEFLDLCDRLGFLVMDEAFDEFTPAKNKWILGWNQGVPGRFGYSEFFADWSVRDISDQVRRDRNHPSVVMWSIGNEIDYPNDPFTDPSLGKSYRPGNPPGTEMVKWGRPLVAAIKQLDTTRPVTAALASVAMSNAVGFAQILDIDGYNYQEDRYAADRQRYPQRVIYGSENKHDYSSWTAVRDNPMISGQFLWTGVDYLGEARAWPARANPDGLLDLCGFVKPLGRFRQSLWSSQPMVYLCAEKAGATTTVVDGPNGPTGDETWNWPDKTLLTVSCYTNCPEITLMLNDQPLGTKRLDEAVNGALHWQVPYVAGVLRAVGRKEGQAVCEFSLRTAAAAKRIELHTDLTRLRANFKDVAQVEFDVVDAQGVRVPDASDELTFELKGPAQILGLGNGDVTNSEPVRGPVHRAYHGRGLAIVQSSTTPGSISLRVSSPGLDPATLTLNSQ